MEPENSTNSASLEELLHDKVEKWRSKLLDIGNRNPLVSCSFNPSRGVIEIVTPDSERVWRSLAADSEAGADPMRFPWRRELIPPPVAEGSILAPKKNRPAKGVLFSEGSDPGSVSLSSTPTANEPANEPMTVVDWNPSLDECRMSPRLRETDLLTEMSDRVIERRLRTVDGHARLAMSEQGVHVLYIAFGFLKWFESKDSEDERRSPLILVPVTLSRKSTSAPWELTEAEDDAIDNLCLRQRLRQDFSLELPPLPDINELEEPGARIAFLDSVRTAIKECDRWEVEDRAAIGLFAFPKVAMWKDLGDHTKAVINHPLCRSIGGDTTIAPMVSFGPVDEIPDGDRLDDDVPPGEVKAILDCDSSQLEAIVAARRGVSLVLDGPPGTGKSQTIANIIADALSEGRTILFVSEKVSALGVVKRRLDEKGLGDFCLECHSSKANRKSVLFELESCLGLQAEVYTDAQPKLDEVKQRRDVLNDYIRSVHRPRMPLGLSPYELYGQVGRLTRLGFATKSRCELPDAASVDRTTFDSWLRLLGQAVDSAAVIKSHDVHPWRGCKLTSRSLSLADDLQHHLAVLFTALETIDRSLSPLVAEDLLAESPTPATLNDTIRSIAESLTAPEIPAIWFESPAESTAAMLSKLNADDNERQLRTRLSHFVGDIARRFPASSAAALSTNDKGWTLRFVDRLPDSLRGQILVVNDMMRRLTEFSGTLNDTEIRLAELVAQLHVPIKSDLPIGSIPRLIELAGSICESGTMRPAWLAAENWTELHQIAEIGRTELHEAEMIAATLHDRIPATRLQDLAGCVRNVAQLKEAWRLSESSCPTGTPRDLEQFAKSCRAANQAINDTRDAVKSLWSAFGMSHFDSVTLSIARRVPALTPAIADAGIVHGTWADAGLRVRLRTVCETAVEDLEEASSLRELLSSRLSHRAFKDSSLSITTKASQYSSFFRRLFGGFAAFKKDVAELYKDRVPGTVDLLSDMDRLNRHHRRIEDVKSAADEHRQHMLPSHDAQDAGAWRQLKSAIDANEAFFMAAGPQGLSSGSATRVDPVAITSFATQLSEAINRIRQTTDGTPLAGLFESLTLDEMATKVAVLHDAATVCHEAITKAGSLYDQDPPSTGQLFNDVAAAIRREEHLCRVRDTFAAHPELMPVGGTPTDPSTWRRITAGVSAAERLSRLVRNPQALHSILCSDSGIDANALIIAIDGTNASYHRLLGSMQRCEDMISLSLPNEPETESSRRPISAMKAIAISVTDSVSNRFRQLEDIIGVLRNECDANISRLPEDGDVIERLNVILAESAAASQHLAALRIADPHGDDKPKILWLAEFAAAGRISQLVRTIASSKELRERCRKIVADVRAAMSGEFKSSWDFLKSLFDLKADVSSGITIANAHVGQLAAHLKGLQPRASSMDEWLKFSRWRRDMLDGGFLAVVDELLEGKYEPEETVDVVSIRFYRKLFDHLAATDHALAEFDIEQHERVRERFRQLDEWEIRAASTRIRQYQLGRTDRPRIGTLTGASSELGILQREIAKKRKHMPLRRLFAEIPSILQRLKPCIMMSPLSVSTFLENDQIRFDLVIFDEASQVFPWDAIGAIYRGGQTIVAGDEKQLPPTNFFSRADAETDEEDDIGDFESILSLCKSINMPSKRLRWHYRSKREPLIAFSNRHFYDGDLVTFPSVRDASGDAVRFDYVPEGRWVDRKNIKEAERVADLVIHHLRTQPEKSLGVITFNQTQQRAIEDIIYDRRRNDPRIDAVFSVSLTEPMFIKNLETVQGDERDVILLSMAYGFNDANKPPANFGPINKSGGERRLNVAVTRAKEEIIFVSSVRAADLDLSRSTSEGAHLLKAYLEYAEKGVDSLARAKVDFASEAESPFEEEVAAALQRHGLEPVPQVGCGGFRIDMALKHPDRPGEYCLGIECDGATYHSSQTARDRDRIRQSILESLGWRMVRVWSTDWVRDPTKQVNRILAAYELAMAAPEPQIRANDATEEEDLDLKPTVVKVGRPTSPTYSSITDVPNDQILKTAVSVVLHAGATEFEDLIKLTARELGFLRLGPRIRRKLEESLTRELEKGSLQRIGDRISVPQHK
ncbi:MAG: DUF4011 domain-containing protein [Planctomycetota bacterium]|nr:MAG: DUF4011 domain-containing protein [Planctomycetota bacterium]